MFRFVEVTSNSKYFSTVETLFQDMIQPLYGDQTEALKKIGAAQDRKTDLMLDTASKAMGIIVYKIAPNEEFKAYQIDKPLELKTLFVINPEENSGKGLGSRLEKRVYDFAVQNKFSHVVVTVSEEKPESRTFFSKKGFQQIDTFSGKYKQNVTEHLYAKKVEISER